MSHQILSPFFDIDDIPDSERLLKRFEETYSRFMDEKKQTAAEEALREEFGNRPLTRNQDLINRVAGAIDDEALAEKRFVFLSVNREYLESLGHLGKS